MSTRAFIKGTLFFGTLLFSLSAQAFVGSIAVGLGRANNLGEVKVSFSADAQIETEEGQFSSKMNYSDNKIRDVVNMAGQSMTTITRYDMNKIWAIMGQGMYMETDIGESQQTPDYKLVERTVVGQESVNGQETTKYKTRYESSRGKFGGFTWYNDQNIAVKAFMISEENGKKTRVMFDLTNIQVGPQANELFELPAGARRFSMPSFGGMQGMSGMQSPPANASSSQSSSSQSKSSNGSTSDAQPDASNNEDEQSENIATEAAQAAEDGAREAVLEESKRTARDAVKKGFGSLFGR